MPYDVSDLTSNSGECTSALGISVTYRLANVTPRLLRQFNDLPDGDLNTLGDAADRADTLADMVRTLVIRWDLTDRARYGDEPVPLTDDALADVRVEILGDVVAAIIGDAGGNPTTGTASPRPSRGTSVPATKRGSSVRRG